MPTERQEYPRVVFRARDPHKLVLPLLTELRESVLQDSRIVPLEVPKPESLGVSEIRIEAGAITVSLPQSATEEQLTAILSAIKSC